MSQSVPATRATAWPPIPGISESERNTILRLILEGVGNSEAVIPADLKSKLAPEAIALIRELSNQVLGRPGAILDSSQSLAPPWPRDLVAVQAARRFLRGFAHNRLGQLDRARAEWALLATEVGAAEMGGIGGTFEAFRGKILVEEAIYKHNRGEFVQAIEELEACRRIHGAELDTYTQARLLGGLALSYIYTGGFPEADRSLEEQERLFVDYPTSPIAIASMRVRISLDVERDEFARAGHRVGSALTQCVPNSVNHAFLVQLKLRLNLARNELDQAEATLEELQELTRKINLPLGVLNSLDERVDLLLRQRRGREAMNEITGALAEAEGREDPYARFKHLIFRARVVALHERYDEALRYLDEAISIGESQSYRSELVWAYFHAAGISFRAEAKAKFKLNLNRGRRLAERLNLRVRASCFSYLLDFHESKYDQASSIVSLLEHNEIGPEVEYFLDFYGLLNHVSLRISDGIREDSVNEPEFRRRLLGSAGVFWFQREGVLSTNRSQGITTVRFPKGSPLLVGFRMLLGARDGLTLRDFHQARTSQPFNEQQHASAAKMVVSRLRGLIEPCGFSVELDRDTGRYKLSGDLPLLSVQMKTESPPEQEGKESGANDGAQGGARDRNVAPQVTDRIARRVQDEGFVTTAELCQELGMSRQALHPYLKRLVHAGKIRLIRRGPISGYRPEN